jgi:lipopolysaccharide export LptBFGC system permease protein LptF
MKILRRYVLQELWLPFAMSFLTLNFIFMAGYLVKAANLIIGRGIPLFDTLYVIMLAMPEMISYTMPTSILTAVMIVFGNLSQNNEIRAMKASGVNPITIMTPALLAGLVLSFGMLVFNDQIATNADFMMRKTTKRMLIKHPAALIEPGRFVRLSDSIVFLAKSLKGNDMTDIVAYENEGTDKNVRTIIAERGEIVKKPNHSELTIRLYDGSVSDAQDASVQSIQFKTYEFPTIGQENIDAMQKKMRNKSLAELLLNSGHENLTKKDKREIWSSFHQRISFAFGSFIFVFVGIPIAILVRRGEIILSFGIAMASASIYYILFVGAKTIAVQGLLPAVIAFWIPNLLLAGLGMRLLKQAVTS